MIRPRSETSTSPGSCLLLRVLALFLKFAAQIRTVPVVNLLLRTGLTLAVAGCPFFAAAEDPPAAEQASAPSDSAAFRFGGRLQFRGAASWPYSETLLAPEGSQAYADGALTNRFTVQATITPWLDAELHYEIGFQGGDTWRVEKHWDSLVPGLFDQVALPDVPPRDRRRLLNLTRWLVDKDEGVLYHRLDRLALTLHPGWGLVRVGRQAVTWGNGLIFNPMDLFNPFSPTDVDREYKVGDDMVLLQVSPSDRVSVQGLGVPRRDPASGLLRWDQSSAAAKLHLNVGGTEWDLMGANHYGDWVLGLGVSGTLGPSAWRCDATWTALRERPGASGYFSLVANTDAGWIWKGRNCYGLVEFFFNGLGQDNYSAAVARPEVQDRLARGELFTLGKTYLAGLFRVELHPLFSFSLTAVANLRDPSGFLLPRFIWEMTPDFRLTLGGTLFYGGPGTEYGGFPLPGGLSHRPPPKVYVWLGWYF